MIEAIITIVIIIAICCIFMVWRVQATGGKNIISMEKASSDIDAVIVLGAGVKEDGSPSAILEDRLKTAIEVLNKNEGGKIILSGDHGEANYNEVGTMKDYIVQNMNIDEKDIFLDHAGFSTYDTMYRAREIFKVKKALIITNEYHLPRALYIANSLGLEALGVKSDLREYYYMDTYVKREKLAQIKDFIYVNILKPEPKFLGEAIPVNSSDGRITDDSV